MYILGALIIKKLTAVLFAGPFAVAVRIYLNIL